MSDPNAYVNTFIDTSVGMLHEYLGQMLQLKTQIKLANDLIVEKDQQIASLLSAKQELDELRILRDKYTELEKNFHAVSTKASHFDSMIGQVNQLKQDLITVTNEKASLEAKLVDHESILKERDELSKKVTKLSGLANITKKKSPPKTKETDKPVEIEANDF